MDTASFASPDAEITALRALLAERDAALAERDALLLNTRLEVEKLKVLLARARREQFGQSSERQANEIGQLEMLIGDLEESQTQPARQAAPAASTQAAARASAARDRAARAGAGLPLRLHRSCSTDQAG